MARQTLWTPATAQGAHRASRPQSSTGTLSGNVTNTLNSVGQVRTFVNGSPSIWTPTTPNGMSGTYTANAQWQGLSAMNGFGQAIINSNFPLLFDSTGAAIRTVGTFKVPSQGWPVEAYSKRVWWRSMRPARYLGTSRVARATPPGDARTKVLSGRPPRQTELSGTTAATCHCLLDSSRQPQRLSTRRAASWGPCMLVTYLEARSCVSVRTAGTYYDLTTISGVPVGGGARGDQSEWSNPSQLVVQRRVSGVASQ